MADERFARTDLVHDLVGSFCKMVFDILEKDFVAILLGFIFFKYISWSMMSALRRSAALRCASTRLVLSVDRIVTLSTY